MAHLHSDNGGNNPTISGHFVREGVPSSHVHSCLETEEEERRRRRREHDAAQMKE
jgi:hypothetical protein